MTFENPIQFLTSHKPRFFEIDPYGHLSAVHYLAYFMDHRFTGLAKFCGFDAKELAGLPVGFYTSKVTLEYKRPVFHDMAFDITSIPTTWNDVGTTVRCEMTLGEGKVAAVCTMDIVCVDKKTGKPCPWPEGLFARFFHPKKA